MRRGDRAGVRDGGHGGRRDVPGAPEAARAVDSAATTTTASAGARRRRRRRRGDRRVGRVSGLSFGAHAAIASAIGFLFLGGGTMTFSTDNASVAALWMATYPRFPKRLGQPVPPAGVPAPVRARRARRLLRAVDAAAGVDVAAPVEMRVQGDIDHRVVIAGRRVAARPERPRLREGGGRPVLARLRRRRARFRAHSRRGRFRCKTRGRARRTPPTPRARARAPPRRWTSYARAPRSRRPGVSA